MHNSALELISQASKCSDLTRAWAKFFLGNGPMPKEKESYYVVCLILKIAILTPFLQPSDDDDEGEKTQKEEKERLAPKPVKKFNFPSIFDGSFSLVEVVKSMAEVLKDMETKLLEYPKLLEEEKKVRDLYFCI